MNTVHYLHEKVSMSKNAKSDGSVPSLHYRTRLFSRRNLMSDHKKRNLIIFLRQAAAQYRHVTFERITAEIGW